LKILRALVVLATAMLCAPAVARADTKIKVVASFSIIADLVRQVGGEHVDVVSLVGPNTDMHVFQPSPAHSKMLAAAQLVVINGLGFEGWADRLVQASGYKGVAIVASKGIKALADTTGHGRYDPHAWQEVANVKTYVTNIRDALVRVDPSRRADFESAADRYLQVLDALDQEIRATFADIPQAQRKVITSHDAFTYYGDAYGIRFHAPQGVSGDSEPTARDVAQLIRQIRQERVKALFVENISDKRLIERIVKETGATLGGALYSDALSQPTESAGTYVDMMRHNTRLIAQALK
jgi:zinc/manganese transport system substrate-binding protein